MITAFETSSRALKAQQRGLDVTSNNIANVNTPGYTRQEAIMAETDPLVNSHGQFGTGVVANGVKQYREEWLDREMRNGLSRQSGYSSDSAIFQQIQSHLQEPGDAGLDSSMSAFYSAVEKLSSSPNDPSMRQSFASAASSLANTFNYVGSGLSSLRTNVYNNLGTNINQVNQLLAGIADINSSLAITRTTDGQMSSTLTDKQNVLLEQLSKLGDVQVSRVNGIANVSMNGMAVVANDKSMKMQLQQSTNSSTGEVSAGIALSDWKGNPVGSYIPVSGELSSQMKFYNVTLDDKDSSGSFSLAKNINTLANSFATKVNALSQTGYGLNDTGTTPPGRLLFTTTDGGPINASNIQFNPALISNPDDIPAASMSGEPGNNDIIRQIGQVANDSTTVGNLSASQFYAQTLTTVANIGSEATNGSAVATATVNQVTSQRDAAVGVNMDEETVNMIKYQRAFEAAARMISVTSEMMKTIVNLGS